MRPFLDTNLLTRAMLGCYVYFEDDETRRFFQSRLES